LATVQELQAENARLESDISSATEKIGQLVGLARQTNNDYAGQKQSALASNLAALHDAARGAYSLGQLPWDSPEWSQWQPAGGSLPPTIAVGELSESRSRERLGIPFLVGLIGSHRPLLIRSSGEEQAAVAVGLIQSLVVRTSVLLPQQLRYTLLDPGGQGMAFPMARYLARVEPSQGDVRRDLDAVTLEIQRIIQTYLDAATPSFDLIPDDLRLSEAFHFVFAANYPQGYDLRAAEALQSIARSGPAAGVYLVLHHNTDIQAPTELGRYAVENPQILDIGVNSSVFEGIPATVTFNRPPAAELQQLLLERVRHAPPIDRPVAWDDLDQLAQTEWWSADATDRIRAPIGRHGANQELSIYFGVDERDNRPCAHGLLAAMTGAGKTGLFHTYIASLTTRYGPDELKLFLLDGKFGVSFRSYRNLPHAEVVSLRTRPELARSVLAELLEEMERRNELFKRHRVEHFAAYRALGSPGGGLPRMLLIADEFQLLFEDDRDGEAANALLRLSEQARSAGIHLLLGSQHFAPANMTNRNLVFANLHLRMAMQLVDSDINSTTDFGPNGRRLIGATCDRPGRLVFNERAGNDHENIAAKVALLSDERRYELIELLNQRLGVPVRPVVFDGHRQPDFVDNPLLACLLDFDVWPTADRLEALARTPMADAGLGWPDWLAAERPVALFLGQSFSVRGQAAAVLRRRQYEHLCVIGEQHAERLALISAALTSACVQLSPAELRIVISDRSVTGTDWSTTLEKFAQIAAETGYDVARTSDELGSLAAIATAAQEVERRSSLPELQRLEQPVMMLVLAEPNRTAALQRIADDYGYQDAEPTKMLQRILDQGPALGVHVIAGFTSVGAAVSMISDKRLQASFRHKVAMQMSEDDSFVVVRSPKATRLQPDGPRPVAALLFDAQNDRTVKFKPYTITGQEPVIDEDEAGESFDAQTEAIFGLLRGRGA
jgi:DNA segregation ATPase FtsK/SpoIIIE, S-DNA-T family